MRSMRPPTRSSPQLGERLVELQDVHVAGCRGSRAGRPWVWRAMRLRKADGAIPVACATMGIWTVASSGVMSGSYPLPDVVTRSGVGFTPSLCQ